MLRAKVYAVLDRRLREGRLFAHSPLQEIDDMLIKSVTTRIQRQEGKRICVCLWIVHIALGCTPVSSVCICVPDRSTGTVLVQQAYECMIQYTRYR